MKIAIIGCGNMGGAIARGLAADNSFAANNKLAVSNRSNGKLEKLKAEFPSVEISTDNKTVAADADIVIFAVKPWLLDAVVAEMRRKLGAYAYPVVLPIGKEDKFRGVVDVINQKAYIYDDTKDPEGLRYELTDIPADISSLYRAKVRISRSSPNTVPDISSYPLSRSKTRNTDRSQSCVPAVRAFRLFLYSYPRKIPRYTNTFRPPPRLCLHSRSVRCRSKAHPPPFRPPRRSKEDPQAWRA